MEGIECEIIENRYVGEDMVAVTVSRPSGFTARPGQFLQVHKTLDEPVTRHYTISSPFPAERLTFTVGIDPDGTLSPWFADATAGDTIEIDGPFGRVYYENEPAVLPCARGPGIGPALAIAERAVAEGGEATVLFESSKAGQPFVYEDRLARLGRVADVHIVREHDFRTVLARSLDAGATVEPASPQVFAYGFEPFIEAVRAGLADAGLEPSEAKLENFG